MQVAAKYFFHWMTFHLNECKWVNQNHIKTEARQEETEKVGYQVKSQAS